MTNKKPNLAVSLDDSRDTVIEKRVADRIKSRSRSGKWSKLNLFEVVKQSLMDDYYMDVSDTEIETAFNKFTGSKPLYGVSAVFVEKHKFDMMGPFADPVDMYKTVKAKRS